ncbi:MAG: hypothetical protein ACOC9T_01115 [Myxococcota bacterium]
MPKPRRKTRIIVIDGEVLHVRWCGRTISSVRQLSGWERELPLRMLDDVQFEIEATLLGGNRS